MELEQLMGVALGSLEGVVLGDELGNLDGVELGLGWENHFLVIDGVDLGAEALRSVMCLEYSKLDSSNTTPEYITQVRF
jgi:hypothetical protein